MRESRENEALSPLTQMCPFGTFMCSVVGAYSPVGSTQTISPGNPMTLLQIIVLSGSIGDFATIKSPRLRLSGKSRYVMLSSMTISPSTANVGSIDGPVIYIIVLLGAINALPNTDLLTKLGRPTYLTKRCAAQAKFIT